MDTPTRLTVNLARLKPAGEWIRGETAPELLDFGLDEFVKPQGGIHYELKVEVIGTEALVRGQVRQLFICLCARCNIAFELPVAEQVVCSFEISEGVDSLDLTTEVREAIILALPNYPVCREECCGLCITCGADLNQGMCTCVQEVKDNRWSALDQLDIEGLNLD